MPAFITRLISSFLLWPLAGCLGWTLLVDLYHLPWQNRGLLAFGAGFLGYLAVQIFFWKPLFVYVMGHELTHALAAVVQGGKADELRVSSRGGAVKVNKSNFFVNLAPYFFPIYTFGIVVIYFIADPKFRPLVLFLLGFTLAFHLALTLYSLQEHQSDIAEVGWFFAIPLIAAINFLVVAFVLGLCLPESPHFIEFLKLSGNTLIQFSRWLVSIF